MSELALNKNTVNGGLEANSNHIFQLTEKDSRIEYFSERAKKLATAVYIVTNLIPQTDPLRLAIREFSIKLLSFMGSSLIGHSPKEVSVETINLSKKIVEMLEIAFFSGYISEMNFSVLKSEFDLFINEVSSFDGGQKVISPLALKVGDTNPEMSFKESDKNSRISEAAPKGQKVNSTSNSTSGVQSPKNPPQVRSAVEAKKMSRKEAVISIIKLKGAISIKDISSVIINCSEKTIQRELMTLVSEGILKKSGERRWSIYSLAK